MSALKWKIMQNFGEQTMCVIWDVKMVDFPVCPSYRESPSPPTVQSDQEPQEPGYRSCLLVVSWWFRFALTIRELSSFSISTSLRLYSFTSNCFFFLTWASSNSSGLDHNNHLRNYFLSDMLPNQATSFLMKYSLVGTSKLSNQSKINKDKNN